MRVRFDLKDEPREGFSFVLEGKTFRFAGAQAVAKKSRMATNVHEYVYPLPDGRYVYLTVVGDEDQVSGYGIARGWYVAEALSKDDGEWLVKALAPFTQASE